jgi:hypothetical protein
MLLQIGQSTNELEVGLMKLGAKYPGFATGLADTMSEYGSKVRPKALMNAMNPNCEEKPFFVIRTAIFFIAWMKRHPRSGFEALQTFTRFIVANTPEDEQMIRLNLHVAEMKSGADAVAAAKKKIQEVGLRGWANEVTEPRRRRRIKQPPRGFIR